MVNEPAQPKQQHATVLVLLAILLAAIAVAAVIYLIPGREQGVPAIEQEDGATSTVGLQGFNTGTLQSSEYTSLDSGLFTRGLLPVQPPAGTGKANIFR